MADNDATNPNPCPVCRASPFERCFSNGFPGEVLPHVSRPSGRTVEDKGLGAWGLGENKPIKSTGTTERTMHCDGPLFSSRPLFRELPIRKQWTAHGFRSEPLAFEERGYVIIQPQRPFLAHYLIVTSSGFYINRLMVGNLMLIWDVPGDVYRTERWDDLERQSALDRVRLPKETAMPGNRIAIEITNEVRGGPRRFSAALIGEELC